MPAIDNIALGKIYECIEKLETNISGEITRKTINGNRASAMKTVAKTMFFQKLTLKTPERHH